MKYTYKICTLLSVLFICMVNPVNLIAQQKSTNLTLKSDCGDIALRYYGCSIQEKRLFYKNCCEITSFVISDIKEKNIIRFDSVYIDKFTGKKYHIFTKKKKKQVVCYFETAEVDKGIIVDVIKSEPELDTETGFSIIDQGGEKFTILIDTIDRNTEIILMPEVSSLKKYEILKVMASFPGGDEARRNFIEKNLVYPRTAKESGITGTVYITFMVDIDGSTKDVAVLRGIGGGCDEEAVRVTKLLPKWNPAKINGKNIPFFFNMPIRFSLE